MIGTLRRRLAGRSPGELLGLIGTNVSHLIQSLRPAAIRRRRDDARFDRRWATETSGIVSLSGLAVDPTQARHGVHYQPSSGEALTDAVERLGITPGEWSLVDYGSGKGRIVMMGAAMHFGRVVGVEFSPELCTIAEENVCRFVEAGGTTRAPHIVLGDAGAFELPTGPVLAYLYNPFDASVLDRVVGRLEAKGASKEPVIVVYVDPRHLSCFEASGRWRVTRPSPDVALLTFSASAAPADPASPSVSSSSAAP